VSFRNFRSFDAASASLGNLLRAYADFRLTLVLTMGTRLAFLTALMNLHRVFGDASSVADSPAVQRRETWRCALVFGVLRGSSEISA
jgi:hypothetical protein